MSKQLLFAVEVQRFTPQIATINVPVTVDDPFEMSKAKVLATMKATDAARGNITLADPITWKMLDQAPLLMRINSVTVVKKPTAPQETYSLLCSSLLSLVKGSRGALWKDFLPQIQQRITKGVRWLDDNHDNMTDEVLSRLASVKVILSDMEAPDELTRKVFTD